MNRAGEGALVRERGNRRKTKRMQGKGKQGRRENGNKGETSKRRKGETGHNGELETGKGKQKKGRRGTGEGKENGAGRDSMCADTATLVDDLVLKIAELQREKWTLQERVTLLEEANAALVGDVAAKAAIIDRQLRSKWEHAPEMFGQR